MGNSQAIDDLQRLLRKQEAIEEIHEAIAPFTAAGLLGEDSWLGWAIDLFNGASDVEFLFDLAILTMPRDLGHNPGGHPGQNPTSGLSF